MPINEELEVLLARLTDVNKAIELMKDERRSIMLEARELGATYARIGEAAGMTVSGATATVKWLQTHRQG